MACLQVSVYFIASFGVDIDKVFRWWTNFPRVLRYDNASLSPQYSDGDVLALHHAPARPSAVALLPAPP